MCGRSNPRIRTLMNTSSWESFARLGRLVKKELSEILRDRRTIVTLVLMPLLLYPLLSVAFQQFYFAGKIDPNRGLVYKFGFASEKEAGVFLRLLADGDKLLQAAAADKGSGKGPPPLETRVAKSVSPDLEQLVKSGEVDLAVRIKEPERFDRLRFRDVTLQGDIFFVGNNPASQGALTFVERRLAAVHADNLEVRMRRFVPGDSPVALLKLERTTLEAAGADSMDSLAALVPLILILMTITGAVYPAIDVTAGERERGTLEILVAAPVPRLGLLFAKYVTVFTVAVLTALVNLVTMLMTVVLSGLGPMIFRDGLSFGLVVQIFGLLLLFAAFFSALLLSLTSFARSFKEAQAYLIPLMLASLGPGLIGMMPGLNLEGPLAAVPLINIVLLARDLFKDGAEPFWAAVVVLTTLSYAAAAIALAARVFGAEAVLYNEQSGWSDLLRRPEEPRPVATPAAALWCLALMLPAHFVLHRLGPAGSAGQFLYLALLGIFLFGLLPAFSAYMGRVRWHTGFGLLPARPLAYAGGLILGLSLWPLLLQLLIYLLGDKPERLAEMLGTSLSELRQGRQVFLGVMVAALVVNAVLEELFFRGYLFGALLSRLSVPATIGLSALLFGLMHVVLGGAIGLERFLPSTLLGLLLGWVRWTSGSVLPGMLLHACHNALLNVLPILIEPESAQTLKSIPLTWQAGGALGTAIGAALIWLQRRKS